MKTVILPSGLTCTPRRLRGIYRNREEFEYYAETFGVARRVSLTESVDELWKRNPYLVSSANPADLAEYDPKKHPSARLSKRFHNLMPGGVPRYVRCYDNGGESGDRYTVCFTGKAGVSRAPGYGNEYSYRAMSAHPFDPQGIGLWCGNKHRHCDVNKHGFAPAMGRKCHLGRRIPFANLPKDCQKLVLRDYREIWRLAEEK